MKYCLFIVFTIFSLNASAIDPITFDSEEQRLSFQKLTEELRCLVCQNQNIADSDAPLAQDLRKEVAERLHAGQTERQISDFMVERYGDFVQYSPPLRADTLMLWILPIIVLMIAAFMLIRTIKKTQETPE